MSYDQLTDNIKEMNERGEVESFKNIIEVVENEGNSFCIIKREVIVIFSRL
jgi:hypothetical protein